MSGWHRLHTDEKGVIWSASDKTRPQRHFRTKPEQLVESQWIREAEFISLLGIPANAELICCLYDKVNVLHKNTGQRIHVILYSPAMCKNRLDDPLFVMTQLFQPQQQAYIRHELIGWDYAAYKLIMSRRKKSLTPSAYAVLYHPAWAALSFLPTKSTSQSIDLLCKIVDPRWFIHPGHPSRLTKLYSYLGLQPTKFDEGVNTALMSWASGFEHADEDDPRNFLVRIAKRKGYLAATKKFVQFLSLVWMRVATNSDKWFSPELFFKRDDERDEFEDHWESYWS